MNHVNQMLNVFCECLWHTRDKSHVNSRHFPKNIWCFQHLPKRIYSLCKSSGCSFCHLKISTIFTQTFCLKVWRILELFSETVGAVFSGLFFVVVFFIYFCFLYFSSNSKVAVGTPQAGSLMISEETLYMNQGGFLSTA